MVILIGGPHGHSDDEPSLAASITTAGEGRVSDELMTTVMMIRVSNDQICVIITAGKGDEIGSLTNGV